jgi:hypothetical protein
MPSLNQKRDGFEFHLIIFDLDHTDHCSGLDGIGSPRESGFGLALV